ncbi:acetylgalactosaminyl-O-glycosyl-glycoprotein beta-1,3-N-acetylglucosaminyltransferase-like [Rana temporaria]|uniref:acetylgalactosaminyl-O-glycosyl-glycoprotein beta-1,3-N-acetylglucosaminyltransferase-like n=1 Tax=Rana temporaria TaxID=8407 RepID=UPI001AACE6C2|nr:acetylgalactosaminyl-O-glycosyl-glycoprotein beta-1,3-N-acetylglucosaminyltransferase-like [Rana temporaria]XP_040177363.1 acetylgalactosaminyl-O-glycosyl-glycoprotein beta-1,3-N-acetylglucosaminyltransferase-like [Rana temporaria]XP_040177368.1 acetylgalactosaminyl-O-glycosyl-glycoprotein beta-1,3-N-acetylglucosaminyltransferase-like [Rana temporaria]
MRRPIVKVGSILLLCVGFVGLLFIMQESKDKIEEIEDRPVFARHVICEPAIIKKLERVSHCQENSSVKSIDGFSKLPEHIKDFLRYKHCRNFSQILNAPQKCGGRAESKGVFLLLAIKTSPGNYERRAIIRQTWGEENSYNGAHVRRIFLSGTSKTMSKDKRFRQLLKVESETYGDILQWNFHDTFFNLTLKQFLFHQWLEDNCPGAHFIFNGDDDVFVNTFNVVTYLSGLKADDHLFVGQLITNVVPDRDSDSKYYVPIQVTSSNSYPMYCAGGGILLSRFTALTIYNKSLEIPLIPIDDVYLGMCLAKAGLVPASHMGMRTGGVSVPSEKFDSLDPCYYRELLMVHRFVPYQMLVMWKAIQDPHLNCGQKRSISVGQ